MTKVDLNLVKRVLLNASVDNYLLDEIISELQSAAQEEGKNELQKLVPLKRQFVVLVADNEGILSEKECVGWILQIPEDERMQSVGEKLTKVAKAFNLSKKGRKFPVATVGETCENVSAKIFKEHKLWLKTKEPVLLVPIKNALSLKEDSQEKSHDVRDF
jgi:hypothetical protein